MVNDDNTRASFKAVADFVEEARLHELVGTGLQIRAANLGTEDEASQH